MNEEQYRHGMDRLVRSVQELSLVRDLDSVMHIVRTVARELTQADGATFILRDRELCFYADEDAISPLWKGSRFPMHSCVSGWAMTHKSPAVIEDIYNDDRVPVDAYRSTFVRSMAMVPIRHIDPIGAIGAYWSQKRLPSAEEVSLLQALADVTAVAMENIQVYNDLEQRVKQRTRELEDMNKELAAFSYSVSHDLRAPLRMVRSYTEMVLGNLSEETDPNNRHLLSRVIERADSMSRLIDDLLEFSRLGNQKLVKTSIAVNEMIQQICHVAQENEPVRKITFQIQDMPEMYGDATMLRQVWENLISNAVKYTGKKENARIYIGCEDKEAFTTYYIKDNGAGFDMEMYDKLFKAFQRLHRAEDFHGTGIGLAIVERIISRHDGRLWAEAEEGKGASFYFTLPKEMVAI